MHTLTIRRQAPYSSVLRILKHLPFTTTLLLFGCGGGSNKETAWEVVDGVITKQGEAYDLHCANWHGLEGRKEDWNIESYNGAMELYVGNTWWADTGRTVQQTMKEIKGQGINTIRLTIAPQTLDSTHPDGIGDFLSAGPLVNHPDVIQENARQALEDFILLANETNIAVLINLYSCSNHIDWQAGGFNYDPGIDPGWSGSADYSCNVGNDQYNETLWLNNLRDIAGLPTKLGVKNVIGIDILNEPWSFTWQEWKILSEKAFKAISEIDPDILIWVEGVASHSLSNIENPHGDESTIPSWGENFYGMLEQPINIPKNKLVLSPHTFGPSTFVRKQFLQGECSNLEGDDAALQKCQIFIDSKKLEAGWEEHFGFLKNNGYAVALGAFGGNMDWPSGQILTNDKEALTWSHVHAGTDREWQNALVDYMKKRNISGCYSSINPEPQGGDKLGGLYLHEYTPDEPTKWGTWGDFDWEKLNLLKRLWAKP